MPVVGVGCSCGWVVFAMCGKNMSPGLMSYVDGFCVASRFYLGGGGPRRVRGSG